MMRRFIISTMLAGTMALPGQMAMAETDLGEMVGTIAKTLLEQQQAAQESSLWQGVVENGSAAAYRQYLDAYPNGTHAREARQRLSNLGGAPVGQNNAARAEARCPTLALNFCWEDRVSATSQTRASGHRAGGTACIKVVEC